PPYGRIKRSQAKKLSALGYKIIMWDVVAKDWMATISEETCLSNILNNSVNGSIIVMHDSMKAFKNLKYALPRVLEHFSSKGFQFKKIEF
ncbi:MAG: polysaccharide deacetylase family protein, partial [Flavobacteriaceae bacterium]|nr:polysaccharide deacetylase family protein [Bacteroidia bacterium]NNL61337.1 polysaccharide deacetylase family protein [Flavobacteriaceae bacterium]